MSFYADFCIPFIVGATVMFAVIAIKYVTWLRRLPKSDLMLIAKGIATPRTLGAVWEVVRESLLHRRIFRVNPLLGYMHMSLAFGWFLLIEVGWIETVAYLGLRWVPLQGHVFFKYFMPMNGITGHKPLFDLVMDLLLLFVLSGVALAWFKRFRSRSLGMKRTTKHVLFDRVALSALWFIFPARLVAESITSALYGGGSFLTGGIGAGLAATVPPRRWPWPTSLRGGSTRVRWGYSSWRCLFRDTCTSSPRYRSSSCATTGCVPRTRRSRTTTSSFRHARAAVYASTPASCRASWA